MKRKYTAEESARYKRLALLLPKRAPKGWQSPEGVRYIVSERGFAQSFTKDALRVVFLSASESVQISLANVNGEGLTDEDIEKTKLAFFGKQAMEVSEPVFGVVYFRI
jgi:hypothetical protein